MVELAVINWLGAQRFGANDHYRKESAILAVRFLESAKEMEECWTIASMCATLALTSTERSRERFTEQTTKGQRETHGHADLPGYIGFHT